MLAVHDKPPFSIEKRLAAPDVLESLEGRKLEVRLLAVDPAHRNRMVIGGLFGHMVVEAQPSGYEVLLISGIVTQTAMYRRMGFRDLGAPVAEGAVAFIPMAVRIADLAPMIQRDLWRWRARTERSIQTP